MNQANALILAAGRGSRLRQANAQPKCLTELFGRTLLEWQLRALKRSGIVDVHLVTGYRHDSISVPSSTAWHNPDWASTNMVHSLLCARPLLESSENLIVAYADIVYEDRIITDMLACADDIVVAVNSNWLPLWQQRMENVFDDVESLRLSEAGYLTHIGQKVSDLSDVQGQYMGLLKFSRAGLDQLLAFCDAAAADTQWASGRGLRACYMTDLLQGMVDTGAQIKASRTAGGWLEVDTPEDLAAYQRLFDDGQLGEHWSGL